MEREGHIPADVSVGRRALTILALIACAGPSGIARAELAGLFWPATPPQDAQMRLRKALQELRHRLSAPDLLLGRQHVRLNPDRISTDIQEFLNAVEGGQYASAVAAYSGLLLEGVEDAERPELTRVILEHRATLYARFQQAAESVADEHDRAGEYAEAVSLWRRLAAAEPFSPHYAMGLVRSLALAGDRTGALQFARVYETLMREELHSPPSPEILDYADALRRGEHLHAARGPERVEAALPEPPAMPSVRTGERARHYESALAVRDGRIPRSISLPSPARRSGRHGRRMRRWPLAIAMIGPLAVAWVITAVDSRAEPATLLDNRVAVLPCEMEGSDSTSHDSCTRLLESALGGSSSLEVVDPILVTDRVQRVGVRDRADRLQVARDLGAAHAIVATVTGVSGTPTIEASLYNVSSGRSVRTRSVTLPADSADVPARMTQLMSDLISPERSGSPAAAPDSVSPRAWRSLQRGLSSVSVWDLSTAATELRTAVAVEPDYPMAAYWLAQVEFWRAEVSVSERRALAESAELLSSELPGRERRQAAGLAHLTRGDWVRACEEFDELLVRDSLNVVAWFGRAECHARDDVVVPDPSSRSGWSFRASRGSAIESYHRALTIVPSAFRMYAVPRFSALRAVYPSNPNAVVAGREEGAIAPGFIAFPELQSDTLALTPVPLELAQGISSSELLPASRHLAAQRAARRLRDFTTLWVNADSSNVQAHEAHALALEENGEVRATLSGNNALWHVQRALGLLAQSGQPDTSLDVLRLRVAEVRLLLKNERYRDVHDMADTLLAEAATLSDSGTRVVLPLASLLGRMAHLDSLVRRAAPGPLGVRPDLRNVPGIVEAAREHEILLAFIVAGMPGDTLAARLELLDATLERAVPANDLPRVRDALYAELRHYGTLYLPIADPSRDSRSLAELAQMLIRTGPREEAAEAVARLVGDMHDIGSRASPSDWLLAARIALAHGDTTRSAEMLELGLAAVSRTTTSILSHSAVAAAIPEMASMRVRLGEVAGQQTAATARWAEASRELRRTADATLGNAVPR